MEGADFNTIQVSLWCECEGKKDGVKGRSAKK